jgi:hypothetical protein
MAIFLSIAALFVLALLATSKRAYRVRRSRLGAAAVAGGWIAIGVGAILGPSVSGLITPDAVLRATPLLSVGLGWIGLMVGLQARRDILAHLPRAVWRLSLTDAALSVGGVTAALMVIMRAHELGANPGLIAGALLAASTVGWSMETRSLGIDMLPGAGGQQRAVLLRASGGLGAILAITTFGIASAIAPLDQGAPAVDGAPSLVARLGALLGASVLAILLAFVAKEGLRLAGKRRAEMLVVFLGVVGLAAGVSADLGVSPLFPAMLTGATFANLRTRGPSDAQADTALFGRFILQAEHVVATIFSLLAGILFDPRITIIGLVVVGAIVLVRVVVKPLAFVLADSGAAIDPGARRASRFASIRQSPVAIAIAVSLFILAPDADAQRLLTIVILVGVTCELLASVAVRRKSLAPPEGDRA